MVKLLAKDSGDKITLTLSLLKTETPMNSTLTSLKLSRVELLTRAIAHHKLKLVVPPLPSMLVNLFSTLVMQLDSSLDHHTDNAEMLNTYVVEPLFALEYLDFHVTTLFIILVSYQLTN
jgi:hypothetical protein